MKQEARDTGAMRDAALDAAKRLQDAGFTALWAGGCVRDMLLGQSPADYDIATSALPDQVCDLFPASVTVGKAFGVVVAPIKGFSIEIATFREDHSYRDGRRPESVSFSDPPTDAARRDFTVNAMFYDPVTEEVLDYVDGRSDLEARVIRSVGDPEERFSEDHLRMLRAVRFAATLDFSLDPATRSAIERRAHLISGISAERINTELTRILTESPRAGDALELLDAVGLLEHILPEVSAMKGQEQPPAFHPEGDVFRHTVLMLNMLSHPDTVLAYAVLLHDIGKPPTAKTGTDRIRFDGHAERGATMARRIMRRLRCSSDETDSVSHAIGNHMTFMNVPTMKRSTLRRLVGAPTFPTELELHRVDCLASHGDLSNYDILIAFREELANEPVLPDPWITGADLIAMGLHEGPELGAWKEKAYEAQLNGSFKDRNALLEAVEREWRDGTDPHQPSTIPH